MWLSSSGLFLDEARTNTQKYLLLKDLSKLFFLLLLAIGYYYGSTENMNNWK